MGLGIVLIFWAIVGSTAGTVGAFVLYSVAKHFIRGRDQDSHRLRATIGLFPFYCLAWAGCVFAVYAITNAVVFDRDPGIGDGWYSPLPNGYTVDMIDVTDRGTLYRSKTQDSNSREAIRGVCLLQLAGRYMMAAADCREGYAHDPRDPDSVLSFFLVDTQTGSRSAFKSYATLNDAATQVKVGLHLEPIVDVYDRFRFTWFDGAAALLMFGVPFYYGFLLFKRGLRIRNVDNGATG
jgi:hypothetical protein